MQRVENILGHLNGGRKINDLSQSRVSAEAEEVNAEDGTIVAGQDPNSEVRWNGWGYTDTKFHLNEQGLVSLTGDKYLFSGKVLPSLRKWMEDNVGLDISLTSPPQTHTRVPEARTNAAFMDAISGQYAHVTQSPQERLFHAHGHTSEEVFALRYGEFKRVPDLVVYPGSHKHVEAIVAAAVKNDVVIIPFGGGTTVTQSLLCPVNEQRMIVSLDMKKMNKIKWVNRKSMMACLEAGVIGKDIEARLKDFGLCMGHEPDSAEFSSLGGWVATRASGMRKNRYGNIEDIVVRIKFVTPQGTLERQINSPRVSVGPDINEIIMGSEGILGVVTEVVVKVCELPECRKYGSVVFPNFDAGVACLHEIAMRKCAPISIRLVDNKQFQFGQALKPECTDMTTYLADMAKKWYVTKVKNFKPEEMVAATLLFEGSKEEVSRKESLTYSIAKKYGGMPAGEENGIRGYFLTYMIAYLRDFGFEYNFLAESFETSVPWDCVPTLCRNVKQVIEDEVAKAGIKSVPLVSSRVTQLYDNGAAVYFYFGFMWTGLKDPIKTFDRVEHAARDEILRLGGSLSHHHGVGKIRKHWMTQTVSPVGMHLLKGIKNTLDPQNIFGNGNLID